MFHQQWKLILHYLTALASDTEIVRELFKRSFKFYKEDMMSWIKAKIVIRTSFQWGPHTCFYSASLVYPIRRTIDAVFTEMINDPQSRTIMRSQLIRLSTFHNYQNDRVSSLRLAEAGFFYTGHGNDVECYACGIRLGDVSSDGPRELHLQMNPNCPHYQPGTANIPFAHPNEYNDDHTFVPEDTSQGNAELPNIGATQGIECTGARHDDRNGRRNIDQTQNKHRQSSTSTHTSSDSSPYVHEIRPSVTTFGLTVFPYFLTISLRRQSFESSAWTALRRQLTPQRMAEAGLFYTGKYDIVRCFHCGIGFQDLNDEDPFTVHARWSPRCAYLISIKGAAFIQGVQEISNSNPPIIRVNGDNPESTQEQVTRSTSSWVRVRTEMTSLHKEIKRLTKNKEEVDLKLENKIKENEKLKNELLCKVCLTVKVDITFLPCGHTACHSCASRLDKCHICRARIREKRHVYFS